MLSRRFSAQGPERTAMHSTPDGEGEPYITACKELLQLTAAPAKRFGATNTRFRLELYIYRSYESEISHSPAASDSVGGSVQDPSQYRTKRGRDSCHLVVAGGGHAEHLGVEKTVEAKR